MNLRSLPRWLLNHSTIVLFVAVFVIFGLSSPRFFEPDSVLNNIIKQSSYTGIIAVGMTFVLLTAGIDLSVGSNMYLSSVIAGLLMRQSGLEVFPALLVALAVGAIYGAVNAFAVIRLRIVPFMVTLATLVIGRGLGTALTESRQIDFPERMLQFGQTPVFGLPMPVIVFVIVVIAAYILLNRTPIGRQIYAVGNDVEAAKKAGIKTERVYALVYIFSGVCAALAGFILISQIGRLDRSFAEGREFDAIAASVLGGTSLFGGVGNVFGAVFGALLTQMVQAGLVFNNVNLYLQPMVRAVIIFIAVFLDSLRETTSARLKRRFIRPITQQISPTVK
ncbi:ABC transporter permease [Anaerolineae bacterium CFX9]|jgi:ribose/xylose/arabinose/galactoside ABC-type transport system permease subunit|nr:ABC transporter permease [Geitlerinema splendidum]MDK3160738.1 ABC transporter permease [Kamptonema cortianum]MDL1900411.1 ABC transporter permease [Anaerolineae bacterium CFX9]